VLLSWQSHFESSLGSRDEYSLVDRWPPTFGPKQPTWATVPPLWVSLLVAGSTSNHIQVDVQGPDHVDASVPESSHQAAWQRTDSVLDHDHPNVQIVHQYSILPSVHSAVLPWPPGTLPRTATDNDSLGTFKSRLKTSLFSIAFNWH